jgi:hypothetical protein
MAMVLPKYSDLRLPTDFKIKLIYITNQNSTAPMYSRLLLILVLCCYVPAALAQDNAFLSGKIQSASGTPLEAATVLLLKAGDSSLSRTAFTAADGSFSLEQPDYGSFFVHITLLGYSDYRSGIIVFDSLHPKVELPLIRLQETSQAMAEVTITSAKPFIEHKVDRTIVNADALLSNAGSTAWDVLEKSPGVRTEENGTISLNSKNGVIIFIDDKPTYLSGTDLVAYLKSLPASAVNQLELMTNPPAKYDAAGSAGIINIKTKKLKKRGANGNFNLGYGQGKYPKSNNSFNFNYRSGKLNVFGNLSYSYQKSFNDLDIERRFKNDDNSLRAVFKQNSYIVPESNSGRAKLGLDYDLSDKTTIGIILNGMLNSADKNITNTGSMANGTIVLDSTILALNHEKDKFRNGGINLNFRHKLDSSGREWSGDVDFIGYRMSTDQLNKNYNYRPEGSLSSNDELRGTIPSDINIYSVKTDYTHPLKKLGQLSAGAKYSFTRTDNISEYFNTSNGITTPDYGKSNHFKYKESITAAYLNHNVEFGRFGLQLGLRMEHTYSSGHQLGNVQKPDSSFTRNYTDLFPTVYLSWKLDSSGFHQLGLSYGKRIDRPFYGDLNPFVSPLDKFTYYTGNPFLRPSYAHNFTLSHNYKNWLNTSLNYVYTKDEFNETIELVGSAYYSQTGNIGKSRIISLSVDASRQPSPWWTMNIHAELARTHYESMLFSQKLDAGGNFYFFSMNNQFKLGKGWNAELRGFYRSKLYSSQFVLSDFYVVNVALQKKVLKDMGTVSIVCSDIFYSRVNAGEINNLKQADAFYTNKLDSRSVMLTFSYRLGRGTVKQNTHQGGAETEQGRVRN